jgi:hypothetical protein
MVHYDGARKKWAIFKTQFQQWDFMDDSKESNKLHKKYNVMIWNLIGRIICDYYQKNSANCKIKFIEADNNAKRLGISENIMYILVLDSSGSMKGKNWQDVLDESKKFLE